jgi:hypothetical protein
MQMVPSVDHYKHFSKSGYPTKEPMHPLLLLKAVECSGLPYNVQLVERLLQHPLIKGLQLGAINERGETALLAAVRAGDAKVGGVLCWRAAALLCFAAAARDCHMACQ